MVNSTMKTTFGGVVIGVVMLLVAFNVSSTTVDTSAFGLYDDLSTQEDTSTNSQITDGDVLLQSSETDGTWTSVQYEIDNETKLSTYAEGLNSNNSLDVTVTGYDADSGGSSTGSKTVTLDSNSRNDVDISSGLGSGVESVDLNYSLSRDSTSDTSPEVTAYEGFNEGSTPYLQYLVAVFGIAVMLFSLRGL